MTLSVDEVRRIASLARLRLSASEEELFTAQLSRIVDYIDQLRSFESSAVAPVRGETTDMPPELADRPQPGLARETFLANAPRTWREFLVVPPVKAGIEES